MFLGDFFHKRDVSARVSLTGLRPARSESSAKVQTFLQESASPHGFFHIRCCGPLWNIGIKEGGGHDVSKEHD